MLGIALLLLFSGLTIAIIAHYAAIEAERRSRKFYNELIGQERKVKLSEQDRELYGIPKRPVEPEFGGRRMRSDISGTDPWIDIRPIVGRWGCLVLVLEFLRGLAVLVVILSVLYLLLLVFS